MCGSGSVLGIRIRIHKAPKYWSTTLIQWLSLVFYRGFSWQRSPKDLPAPLLPLKSKISSLSSFPPPEQQHPGELGHHSLPPEAARSDRNRFLENNNSGWSSTRPENNRSAGFQAASQAQLSLHRQLSEPPRYFTSVLKSRIPRKLSFLAGTDVLGSLWFLFFSY